MVIGLYYLTAQRKGAKGEGRYFGSTDEVRHAYHAGDISLHAMITLRLDDEERTRLETTPGRLFVNAIMPEGIEYINHELDKKKLSMLVDELYRKVGAQETAKTLDRVMQLGFKYSTQSGTSVSVADVVVPTGKRDKIRQAEEEVEMIETQFRRGLLTPEERYQRVCAIWTETKEAVTEDMLANFDRFNPVYMMASLVQGVTRVRSVSWLVCAAWLRTPPVKRLKCPLRQTSGKASPFWNTSFPATVRGKAWRIQPLRRQTRVT